MATKRHRRYTSGMSASHASTYVAKTGLVSRYTVAPNRCGTTASTGVRVYRGMRKGILLMSSMTRSAASRRRNAPAARASVKFAFHHHPRRTTRTPSTVSSVAPPG
jgi:hypothetical protein